MRIHQRVAHVDPVIEATIEIAEPRLLAVVAGDQGRIERRNRLSHRRPFRLAASRFRYAGLKASLVLVRARIPDVLVAIRLGKEQAQADATGHVGLYGIEAL